MLAKARTRRKSEQIAWTKFKVQMSFLL